MIKADTDIRDVVDHVINIEVISEIQKELDACDIISLVFLLYEAPDTALERLILLQRISRNGEKVNLNLLYDWAVYSQARTSWKQEFFEALMICQLYRVVRKLGFNVQSVKGKMLYQDCYIDPLKRELYLLCENTTSIDFQTLKLTLNSYKTIDVTECETCELVLLVLMTNGFISVLQNCKDQSQCCSIEKLSEILDKNSNLKSFGSSLRAIQNKINGTRTFGKENDKSSPKKSMNNKVDCNKKENQYANDFDDVFQMFEDLKMDEISLEHMKSDSHKAYENAYVIKNPRNVGFCYIINQEKFYPSEQSIKEKCDPLEQRIGSTKDKTTLQKTMSALNFEVISHDNLSKNDMIHNIRNVIKNNIKSDHSLFVMCIMSHGVNGFVYAADSVKVEVDYIKSLLYSDDAVNLKDMPKILILQACRLADDQLKLVADSPNPKPYFMKKSDFFTFWATAPEYEAYRCPKRGSIFIQVFCRVILKYSKHLSLIEMCLKVNKIVKKICSGAECDQLSEITFNVTKNIFLQGIA